MLNKLKTQGKPAIKKFIRPHSKYSFLSKLKPNSEVLDVGCGNNSPYITKKIQPSCIYTGIDVCDYNQTESNLADNYILTSPECFVDEISKFKGCADAVISAHNIEYCNDREKTLDAMLDAIKVGGKLFISFPSENSINLPTRFGTLNYFDDPFHKDLPPDFDRVVRTISQAGFEIEFAARNYQPFLDWFRGFLNERNSRTQNRVIGSTWAYHGYESIIWARKLDKQTLSPP